MVNKIKVSAIETDVVSYDYLEFRLQSKIDGANDSSVSGIVTFNSAFRFSNNSSYGKILQSADEFGTVEWSSFTIKDLVRSDGTAIEGDLHFNNTIIYETLSPIITIHENTYPIGSTEQEVEDILGTYIFQCYLSNTSNLPDLKNGDNILIDGDLYTISDVNLNGEYFEIVTLANYYNSPAIGSSIEKEVYVSETNLYTYKDATTKYEVINKNYFDTKSAFTKNVHNTIFNEDSLNNVYGSSKYSLILNGRFNTMNCNYGTILNGVDNKLDYDAHYSSILGGYDNFISSTYSNILGGKNNVINSEFGYASILSSMFSRAEGYSSTILGCQYGVTSGDNSIILGGRGLTSSGKDQTILGSYNNISGSSSSKVDSDYALIVGNGTGESTRDNAFAVTWDGSVYISKNKGENKILTSDINGLGSWEIPEIPEQINVSLISTNIIELLTSNITPSEYYNDDHIEYSESNLLNTNTMVWRSKGGNSNIVFSNLVEIVNRVEFDYGFDDREKPRNIIIHGSNDNILWEIIDTHVSTSLKNRDIINIYSNNTLYSFIKVEFIDSYDEYDNLVSIDSIRFYNSLVFKKDPLTTYYNLTTNLLEYELGSSIFTGFLTTNNIVSNLITNDDNYSVLSAYQGNILNKKIEQKVTVELDSGSIYSLGAHQQLGTFKYQKTAWAVNFRFDFYDGIDMSQEMTFVSDTNQYLTEKVYPTTDAIFYIYDKTTGIKGDIILSSDGTLINGSVVNGSYTGYVNFMIEDI